IKGTPKTAIVKRTPTGKWFVNITVELCEKELQEKQLPPSHEEVGIDVGLSTFAYLSTKEEIANPRFFREEEVALSRAQRKLSKAEEAGRVVVKVNPAYTSQTCSACGHRQPMPLAVRVYECPTCGLVIHRDHNGSVNILADACQAVGRHSRLIPEASGLEPWG